MNLFKVTVEIPDEFKRPWNHNKPFDMYVIAHTKGEAVKLVQQNARKGSYKIIHKIESKPLKSRIVDICGRW